MPIFSMSRKGSCTAEIPSTQSTRSPSSSHPHPVRRERDWRLGLSGRPSVAHWVVVDIGTQAGAAASGSPAPRTPTSRQPLVPVEVRAVAPPDRTETAPSQPLVARPQSPRADSRGQKTPRRDHPGGIIGISTV